MRRGPTFRLVGATGVTALLAAALLTLLPAEAPGQEPAGLERIEELTRLGRTEEAREALLAWWADGRDEASRRDRQRALWIRGRLTVDPAQAELDFRRLVIEYPGGPFSDRALLRLAQASWARGDGEAAERHLDQLQRDYPGSPVAREAREWRSAAGPLPEPTERATVTAAVTAAEAEPSEARSSETPVAEEGAAEESGAETPDPAEAPVLAYAVQLGAFAGEGRARDLRDRIASAGYQARIVRVEGSRLLHVRVGRFADEAEARELLEAVRATGLTAALVRDAHREEAGSS